MIARIRESIGLKIFFLITGILVLGMLISWGMLNLLLPSIFLTHMGGMESMMGGMSGGMVQLSDVQAVTNEAIFYAFLVTLAIAGFAAWLLTRRIVKPIEEMEFTANQISKGDYTIQVPLKNTSEHLDEIDKLSISFNQMAGNLNQIEQMRQQLIGDVSHELRTPLTTIRGTMEALLDDVIEPRPEIFQQVHKETSRLSKLVDDLQELSKVEADEIQLNRKEININDLVKNVITYLQPQYEQKNVQLVTQLDKAPLMIVVDQDRIIQVVTNLLGNALQYTNQGDQVTVVTRKEKSTAIVEITDTGIGIAKEHLPHLFDRFYRVDKSRARISGGSGVGLTIAKRLIEHHGGKITVASEGSELGSSFTISLPFK